MTIYLAFRCPDLVVDHVKVEGELVLYHGFRLIATGTLTAILDVAASAKAYQGTA